MNGRELSAAGLRIMTAGGWVRLWCANSQRPLPKEMRGLSDNGYVRGKVLLFVEDKGDGDKLSTSQIAFMKYINGLENPNVMYILADSVKAYERIVNIGRDEYSRA